MSGSSTSVRDYFSRRHPGRKKGNRLGVFGMHGDAHREIMHNWLPDCTGLSVLDSGCGDGTLLKQVLRDRPSSIFLEDIVEARVSEAVERIQPLADSVEGSVVDVNLVHPELIHDIVLAIGILDYSPSWKELIDMYLARTRQVLIIDFPKTGTLHWIARRVWLRLNGVPVYGTSARGIRRIIQELPHRTDLHELPYNWCLRIFKQEREMDAG